MVVRGLIEEHDTVFRDSLSFCARRWPEKDGLHGGWWSTPRHRQADFQGNAGNQFAVRRKIG